jgi:hypothetical protein
MAVFFEKGTITVNPEHVVTLGLRTQDNAWLTLTHNEALELISELATAVSDYPDSKVVLTIETDPGTMKLAEVE